MMCAEMVSNILPKFVNTMFRSRLNVQPFRSNSKLYSSSTQMKPGSRLDKWIKRENNSRKKWYQPSSLQDQLNSFGGSQAGRSRVSEGAVRRAKHLSLLFHDHVVNFFNSGELDDELLEHEFDISRVELVPDLCSLNIFWISDEGSFEELQCILEKNVSKLRSLLQSCQVMSSVPPVCFVKDRRYTRFQEVQDLLHKADYGSWEPEQESACDELRDSDLKTITGEHISTIGTSSNVTDLYELPHVVTLNRYGSPTEEPKSQNRQNSGLLQSAYGLDHTAMMSKVVHLRKQRRRRAHRSIALENVTEES